MGQQSNNLKKFKNIPFVWESENYLLKLKSDTSQALFKSHFGNYITFSCKNDPFLVYPSIKHNNQFVQGSGTRALRRLNNGSSISRSSRQSKLTIPIPNNLMKIIRQCEVYLMEEAITD
jgi:hypothetical protein